MQAKVEPGSLALKVKLALVAVVLESGPLERVVSGAAVSAGGAGLTGGAGSGEDGADESEVGAGAGTITVQLRAAGVPSVLPAVSVARTKN